MIIKLSALLSYLVDRLFYPASSLSLQFCFFFFDYLGEMAPRTRSNPSTEEAPNPPQVPSGPTVPTTGETETLSGNQISPPTDLDLDLIAVQETIEKLQRLKDLQAQADRLRAKVTG